MDIKFIGHSSFIIKGKSGTVVTDPFNPEDTGLKFPAKIEADIVTVSHDHGDHNAYSRISGSPFVVKGPGEYEIKGIHVIGYPSFHDNETGDARGKNTVYRIELDGVKIVHLGDIGHVLSDSLVSDLGDVDILFVPVGGKYTVNAADAKKIIAEIEPAVYIPMHFRTPDHKSEIFAEVDSLDVFLKEMGIETVSALPKLTVGKDKLPADTGITILESLQK